MTVRSLLVVGWVTLLASGFSAGGDKGRSDHPLKPPMGLRVELLPDDQAPEGMPIVPDFRVRITYLCHGSTSIAKASIRYRVIRKGAPKPENDSWVSLPLPEVKADDKTGPFDPKTAVFKNTKLDQQVPFHALSSDPQGKEARLLGGGRAFLETRGLIDGKEFKLVQLRPGDRIEYCIEVLEIERKGTAASTARSPTRVMDVVSVQEFQEWLRNAEDERRRLRELERKQKQVVPPK